MRAPQILFAATALAASVFVAACNAGPGVDSKRIAPSAFEGERSAALKGDSKAAIRLYEHYEFYVMDHGQATYWLRVGAMAGDMGAASRLGLVLTRMDGNIFEGVCWLERAAAGGDSEAAAELTMLRETRADGTARNATR